MNPKLKWVIDHINKLDSMDAPKSIIAHAVVNLLIPRLITSLDIIEEYNKELVHKLIKEMRQELGICIICGKNSSVSENLCPKCNAKIDQMSAELDDDSNILDN